MLLKLWNSLEFWRIFAIATFLNLLNTIFKVI